MTLRSLFATIAAALGFRAKAAVPACNGLKYFQTSVKMPVQPLTAQMLHDAFAKYSRPQEYLDAYFHDPDGLWRVNPDGTTTLISEHHESEQI